MTAEGSSPAGGTAGALRRTFLAHPRHGPLPALLLVLTAVTGVVDAASILRMGHVFVANMTGNIVFLGFGLAGGVGFSPAASVTALAGFVAGVATTGWFPASWRADRARLLWASTRVKLCLALPVVVVASVADIRPGRPATYVVVVLLAASMGVQNATARRLAVPELGTTLLTMNVTGFFADYAQYGWRHPANPYRVASVACLLAGALVGATLVLQVAPGAALGLGAVLLAVVGLAAQRASRSGAAWAAFDPKP